jgi:hypothetical protein
MFLSSVKLLFTHESSWLGWFGIHKLEHVWQWAADTAYDGELVYQHGPLCSGWAFFSSPSPEFHYILPCAFRPKCLLKTFAAIQSLFTP